MLYKMNNLNDIQGQLVSHGQTCPMFSIRHYRFYYCISAHTKTGLGQIISFSGSYYHPRFGVHFYLSKRTIIIGSVIGTMKMHVNHCEKLCGLCHSLMDNSAAPESIKDTIITNNTT